MQDLAELADSACTALAKMILAAAQSMAAEQAQGLPAGWERRTSDRASGRAALTSLLQHVLPAAASAAETLLEQQRQGEQGKERRLRLTQAAAARACAILRCPNLSAEGGPSAGQGAGFKRCRCVRVDGEVGPGIRHCPLLVANGRRVTACACFVGADTFCGPHALAHALPSLAVLAVWRGTAAQSAPLQTGGRAGTGGCARRWALHGRPSGSSGGHQQWHQRWQQSPRSRPDEPKLSFLAELYLHDIPEHLTSVLQSACTATEQTAAVACAAGQQHTHLRVARAQVAFHSQGWC